MCVINRECKLNPIYKYYGEWKKDYDIVQYVGIAADEPKRIPRLNVSGKSIQKVSLLVKYGYTEEMAKAKCIEYQLLSPLYMGGHRGGCWFCPNCKIKTFAEFRKKHSHLWGELVELSKTPNLCSYGFKYGMTVQEVQARMDAEDAQLKLF